jgi:addiction module HigA family antidote
MPKNAMRPIHPGEVLREEFLGPLGRSAHAPAQALRVPATRIDVVNERRRITADTALRLALYFGRRRSSGSTCNQRSTCGQPRVS